MHASATRIRRATAAFICALTVATVGTSTIDASAAVKKTTKKTVKTTKTTRKAAPATTAPAPAAAPATAGKVNANTATIDELAAAFTAAGIANADRWAAEVDEYRPYPSDPKWGKLRAELGKYNIAPAVMEKIISVLEV